MKLKSRFGSHYAIERFGIVFLTLVICMSCLLGSIAHRQSQLKKHYREGQAIYTSSFMFSKSKVSGNVRGVYVNPDRTKCLLLLRFSDMSKLPIDASEYICMVTGSTPEPHTEPLKSKPNGMMYLFGASGYAGLYFENAEAFPSQILSVTLRSTNNFGGGSGEVQYDDTTFQKFDQARIYFNPGAGNATRVNFLDMDEWNIKDAYAEVVVKGQEKSVRGSLYNTLVEMHREYVKLDEYKLRMDKLGMKMSAFPKELDGDKLYAMNPADKTNKPMVWNVETGYWYSSDGAIKSTETGVNYYYESGVDLPGTIEVDWMNKHVSDGYMKDLTGSDDVKEWVAYLNDQAKVNSETETAFTPKTDWYYADGTLFEEDLIDGDAVNDEQKQMIASTISMIEESWNHLYELKETYQTELMPSLAKIEIDINSVMQSYTTHTNDNGDFLYLY